jgi:chorismate dehydratase
VIRISVVSYLNSRPFIKGLENAVFEIPVEVLKDIPSVCADKLINGSADIGLVPVAVLPQLKNYKIISDYCIGADGNVGSVLLLSDVPLNEIKSVLLDYQSRTSVQLTKVLAKNFWKINPEWTSTESEYEKKISGTTAGVVIGDRALMLSKQFKYVYDLSGEWKKFTSLPFVFACWVSTIDLSEKFVSDFNEALKLGLDDLDSIAEKEISFLSKEEIKNYLSNCIDYRLDDLKKEAMERFLKLPADF